MALPLQVDDQWMGLELKHNPTFEYHDHVNCTLRLERINEGQKRATFTLTHGADR